MAISKLDQHQLADFLSHDIRVHRHIYRQPVEILQKAKVVKILLCVNKGMKSFEHCVREELQEEEIDYDAETKIPEDTNDHGEQSLNAQEERDQSDNAEEGQELREYTSGQQSQAMVKRKTRKRPWTEGEKTAVSRQLGRYFLLNKLPGRIEVEEAISMEPALKNRRWTNIKDYIRNSLVSEGATEIGCDQ